MCKNPFVEKMRILWFGVYKINYNQQDWSRWKEEGSAMKKNERVIERNNMLEDKSNPVKKTSWKRIGPMKNQNKIVFPTFMD
ncbi:hypothetical protein Golax_019278 [Gossypium laxum]|uniref:Uncharacterized protein n=1 Tax=Gossypium laxum TaxID=34288 RepID=A0A7J8Z7K3_9ROSI|nr:hypothetical protein [Gossypium laxum]